MSTTFVVICRGDSTPDGPGPFQLATRTVFETERAAKAYVETLAASREPNAIPGDWASLRFGEPRGGDISDDELAALQAFAKENGRYWKVVLRHAWTMANARINGEVSAELQRVRNRLGPTWLTTFRLPQGDHSGSQANG